MKILLWDIEATNLNANFGIILCVGTWTWLLEEDGIHKLGNPGVYRIDQYKEYKQDRTNDAPLVRQIASLWEEHDVAISWFGGESRFDRPYLRTRMAYHRMHGDLAPIHDIDLWWTSRKRFKLSNNRLNTVQQFLELDDEKSPIKPRHWIRAMAGYKESLDYVVEHCYQDVLVLGQAYERMLPYIPQHPNFNQFAGAYVKTQAPACHRCASTNVHQRGYRTTQAGRMIRYRCMNCGGWSKAPLTKENDLRAV